MQVTVVHNVSGDMEALLAELKTAVGAGGLVREGDVEIQVSMPPLCFWVGVLHLGRTLESCYLPVSRAPTTYDYRFFL